MESDIEKSIGMIRVLPRKTVRLGDLKPNLRNPRQQLIPGDPDFENIRASLKQIGLADEIVWNEATGRVVGGHQRLAVLREEGAEDNDPIEVKIVNIPDEREEMAAVILLNKAEGRWDLPLLVAAVGELDLGKPGDLHIGFSALEIEDLSKAIRTPDSAEWVEAMGKDGEGDEGRLCQMTFTLNADQAEMVNQAIAAAKRAGGIESLAEASGNPNGNGNALAAIAVEYLNGKG